MSIEEYNDKLCEAVDIIVAARINELSFDKTIVCTVTDDSEKTFGKYTVTDGSTTFDAYSENDSYSVNSKVLVLIPNGDWTQQKRITGKYISSDDAPFIYHSPLDGIHNISGNLVESPNEYGVSASGRENEVVELVNRANLNFQRTEMPRLCIKADFKTLLNDYRFTSGSYGIRACFNNEYYIDFSSKTDMFGSVYNFADWVSQEQAYEIPKEIDTITSLVVWLYQDGNFKYIDENGEEAPLEPIKQSETENFKNILIKNTKVFLGTEDTVSTGAYIHTNQSLTYSPGDVKRSIHLRWNLVDSNKEPILIGRGATVQWFVDDEALKQSGESIEINCKEKQTFTQVKARVTLANNTGVFDSNILRFDNQLDKDSKVPLADIKLEIVNDENAFDAYPYYNNNNELIDKNEGEITRTVKLVWSSSKENVDDSYWDNATIEWSIPDDEKITMLRSTNKEEDEFYFSYKIAKNYLDSRKDNTIICTITLAPDKNFGEKQTKLTAMKNIVFSQHPVDEDGKEISPEKNIENATKNVIHIIDEKIGNPGDGPEAGTIYSYIEGQSYVTQESTFNKLTNNGALQGLFMQDNNLYINGSYMTTGILRSQNWEGTLTYHYKDEYGEEQTETYQTFEEADAAVKSADKKASWTEGCWSLTASSGTYWNLNDGQIFAKNFELNAWNNTKQSGLLLNSNPSGEDQYYLSVGNSKNFIKFRQDGKIVIDAFEDSRGIYLNSKPEENDKYWFIIGEGNKKDGGKNNFIQMDKTGNFTIQTNGKFILNAWNNDQGVYINSDADDDKHRYFQIGNTNNYIQYTTSGLEMKIPSAKIYLSDADKNLEGYISTTAESITSTVIKEGQYAKQSDIEQSATNIKASVSETYLTKEGNIAQNTFGWRLVSDKFTIGRNIGGQGEAVFMQVDTHGLYVNGSIVATSGTIGNFKVYSEADIQEYNNSNPDNQCTKEVGLFGALTGGTSGYGIMFDARPSLLVDSSRSKAIGIGYISNVFADWDGANNNGLAFYVRADGYMYSNKGSIGGININNGSLSAGGFSITSEGHLTCTSATIGGWTLAPVTNSAGTSIWGYSLTSGDNEGSDGFIGLWTAYPNDSNYRLRIGSKFSVKSDGSLYASAGKIGDWSLKNFTPSEWSSISLPAAAKETRNALIFESSEGDLVSSDYNGLQKEFQMIVALTSYGVYTKTRTENYGDEEELISTYYNYKARSWSYLLSIL